MAVPLRNSEGAIAFSYINAARKYAVAAAILFVLGSYLLFYSLLLPPPQRGPSTSDSVPIQLGSSQWSGYVAISNLLLRQRTVTRVSGSWMVPTVNQSQGDVFSAAWVGIGGYGESSLIQTGTLQGIRNGEVTYYAWYELLPSTAVRIQSLRIRPGDKMTASVSLVDGSENRWLVEISDLTRGQSYSRTFRYNSSRLSAEWIMERPSISGNITTLADFDRVTFTDCQATIENITGTVSGFPGYQLVMYGDQTQLVRVSALNADGSSFTVDYLKSEVAENIR